jgi:Tol biopolymer transport system component
VVHRDIKPANIKLTPQGILVLVDFGIAKAAALDQATATGAVGYTPGYAPPEQYGTARTGPYSDQYALAATLYTLLTGQRPADSIQRVLGAEVLSPIRLLNPLLPEHTGEAIERAMSVRPEDRFSSVDSFIRALSDPAYLPITRPPVVAPAPSPRQFPWLAAVLGVMGACLALLVITGGGIALMRPQLLAGVFSPPVIPTATLLPTPSLETSQTSVPTSTTQPTVTLTSSPTVLPTLTPTPIPPTPTPTLSPTATPIPLGNGGLIAFSSNRGDGKTFQIWTLRVELSPSGQVVAKDVRQLTDGPGDKRQPSWSADGRRLLYTAPGGKDEKGLDLGTDIWMLDVFTKNEPINLTKRKGDDLHPVFSPDGKFIAFSNNGRPNGVRMVYIMDSDGQNVREISIDQTELSPMWSPDMKYLLYITDIGMGKLFLRTPEDDYKKRINFESLGNYADLGDIATPRWSPDGKMVAYTRRDGLNQERIISVKFAVPVDNYFTLTSTQRDSEPAWSPDSQWIVFTSRRDNNPEIYVMRATGPSQTNLTGNPAIDIEPAWQPFVPMP